MKHKCRIFADGSQQQYGIGYWDTYSPVIQWSTIRLIMILAATLGLCSGQVDYTQAFLQAPLDNNVYMHIPSGWAYDHTTDSLGQIMDTPTLRDTDYCIKLWCNLYSCKQASRNWYLHLTDSLKHLGFQASMINPCLFIKHDCLICLYTQMIAVFLLTMMLQWTVSFKISGMMVSYSRMKVAMRTFLVSTSSVTN